MPSSSDYPVPTARRAARGLATLLAAAALVACSKPEPAPEPVRAVKLITVGASARTAELEYAAEVRPRIESRLGFRVGGKITNRAVELGQHVQAGQLLAQLDPQDLRLATDAARAQATAATTQRDLAAADLKRFQSLRDQGFISAAELERRSASLRAAQATLDQANAQLRAQGNQASYTQLVADAAGVVTAVDAEVGQVVAAGTPVVRIARDGARDAAFSVPEQRVAAVRVGQAMDVRTPDGKAHWRGTVREVAAAADPVTRTFLVKLALSGGDAPPLGATVTVVPEPGAEGTPNVIKLPTAALFQAGQGSAVWVFDAASSTVRAQPVQVVTADGNDVVIGGGLAPGTQVVASGVHVLAPGQKVSIYQPKGQQVGTAPRDVATNTVVNGAGALATPVPAASR